MFYSIRHSEANLRRIEFEICCKISNSHSQYVIALGAGFSIHKLSSLVEVILVSRTTDALGRIFLDRPRLNPKMSALEESQLRFKQRDSAFREQANFIYPLPEGLNQPTTLKKNILIKNLNPMDLIRQL